MTLRPAGLNKAIACLFIVGSALFLLGSVPAYVNAVGATADSITYFIGSIFFTAASFNQLLQACRHDRQRQHGQYDPDWGRQRLLPADE
jgi:hypothetical protein